MLDKIRRRGDTRMHYDSADDKTQMHNLFNNNYAGAIVNTAAASHYSNLLPWGIIICTY